MATIGDIVGKLNLDTRGFTAGIEKANDGFDDLRQRIQSAKSRLDGISSSASKSSISLTGTAKSLGKIGSIMSAAITAPLTGLAVTSINAARSFETAFTGVKKTVDATDQEFAALKQGILAMSQELPASANEIAKVAESAGQLGVKQSGILEFTKTMINLGETTSLNADAAAIAIAKVSNVMGTSEKDVSRFGSTIVALGNNLAANETEITNMASRMAPFAKQVNLSEDAMLAMAGALVQVGIRAEAGGTAFGKVMITMNDAVLNGGKKLEAFAKTSGMSAEAFAEAFKAKPQEAMLAFVRGLENIQKNGGSTTQTLADLSLSNERVKVALGALAGDSNKLAQALEIGNQAWMENTALTEEAEKRYATTDSKIQQMSNAIFAAKTALGDTLLPVVGQVAEAMIPLIKKVGEVIQWFQSLDPTLKSLIVIFTTTFALGGPILLAFSAFIAAIATIGAPILIGGAIVAGLVAGLTWVITNWESLKSGAIDLWDSMLKAIVNNIQANVKNIKDAWASLKGKVLGIVEAMMSGISATFDKLSRIATTVKDFTSGVLGYFSGMYDEAVGHSIIPDMVDDIGAEFMRLDAVMVNPVEAATNKVLKSFNDMRAAMKSANGGMPAMNMGGSDPLAGTTQKIQDDVSEWNKLVTSFKFTTKDAMENLSQSLTQVFSTIRTNFVNSIVGMVAGTNTFADFLNTMWQTMLAAFLNLVIQMGAKWAITQFAMQAQSDAGLIAFTAVEQAKTAVSAESEAARTVISAAANKVALGGAIATVSAMGAVGEAAMAVMASVVTATAGVLTAIGVALAATIVGAPFAPPYFAAAGAVEAAGTLAIGAGTAAIGGAISGAVGTISALMATPFAEGGMVTGPTLAMIGEAGPEVVAPFSEVERMLGGSDSGEQSITIMLDGRVIAKSTARHLPKIIRMQGVPI